MVPKQLLPVAEAIRRVRGAGGVASWAHPPERCTREQLSELCDLGLGCPELGWVSLAELATIRGRFGLPLERDLHFVADRPLSAYAAAAQAAGRIAA